MTNFKTLIAGILVATAVTFYTKDAKAVPNSLELCNWGKWAYSQNITLQQLVDTLNSVEAMPIDDRMQVVQCFVEEMSKS